MLFCPVLIHTEPRSSAIRPRRLVNSFSSAGSRPLWSYLHTGTLLRLSSFVSRSYENTGGVAVFFPFWNAPSLRSLASSPNSLSPLFSNSWALLCSLLHSRKTQPFYFQAIPNSFAKTPGVGVSLFLSQLENRQSLASAILSLPEEPSFWKSPRVSC